MRRQIKNITERHEAEQRIQALLEEKVVLLREIHHRVKNNMQVITSLLQLQSGYLPDPRDAEIFKECQARIHAMRQSKWLVLTVCPCLFPGDRNG